MPVLLTSHLGALREGLNLVRRHTGLTLGLAVMAMSLAQLGPALELAAGAEHNLLLQPLFAAVSLLPLEMYFLPRLQARLDAEVCNRPQNHEDTWRQTFETRWLAAFGARVVLSIAVGLGLVLLIVPGVVVLTLYGWVPTRMLLRGHGLLDSLRWSQAAMVRHWPRMVQAVLAMVMVLLLFQLISGMVLGLLLPAIDPEVGPDAWLRLRHPAFWVINLCGGLLNLWFSCSLLALYHRLERLVQDVDVSDVPTV